MTEVAAAFIENNGKILICKRPPGKNCAYMWEFPGGKIENGETPMQALCRECMEELGIKISAGNAIADTVYQYTSTTVHLTLFEARITSGVPLKFEHLEILWVDKNDFHKYDFCPADKKLIENLKI